MPPSPPEAASGSHSRSVGDPGAARGEPGAEASSGSHSRSVGDPGAAKGDPGAAKASLVPSRDELPPVRQGTKRSAASADLHPDRHAELFGRVDPRHIPESASWFQGQQKNLMALSADHELGLPRTWSP